LWHIALQHIVLQHYLLSCILIIYILGLWCTSFQISISPVLFLVVRWQTFSNCLSDYVRIAYLFYMTCILFRMSIGYLEPLVIIINTTKALFKKEGQFFVLYYVYFDVLFLLFSINLRCTVEYNCWPYGLLLLNIMKWGPHCFMICEVFLKHLSVYLQIKWDMFVHMWSNTVLWSVVQLDIHCF